MTQQQLDSLLKPLVREASLFRPTKTHTAEAPSVASKFGGVPYAESGDTWPVCTKCNDGLVFVAQLLDRTRSELVVFFYCFECSPWGLADEEKGQWCVRRYVGASEQKLHALSPPDQPYKLVACNVTESKALVLPDWEGIHLENKEAADLCVAMNESPWEEYSEAVLRLGCLDDYSTLVSGYARHVQGGIAAACEKCKKPMRFLGQIDSEEEANLMWGDVGLVYLFQCSTHADTFHLELQCH